MNAKKKKRSRCRLCGEQWWDIGPSFMLLHFGFDPQREVQKKYGKCAKINDPANAVWREKCAVYHDVPITFGCAVSEVIRNVRTCQCICPQWRLIRSKKQQVTLVWRMTQISKLKAGGQCAGHCPSLG